MIRNTVESQRVRTGSNSDWVLERPNELFGKTERFDYVATVK